MRDLTMQEEEQVVEVILNEMDRHRQMAQKLEDLYMETWKMKFTNITYDNKYDELLKLILPNELLSKLDI